MLNLRRVTSSTRYIPQIDGLRFLAIASVVLWHIYTSLGHNGALPQPALDLNVHQISKRGVELFFAISGFVLALPFATAHRIAIARPRLKDYFLRRVTRLEPPYLLALSLTALLLLLSHEQAHGHLFRHFLASSVYMHQAIYRSDSTIIPPAWSLEVEIQFYILVPLLTAVFALRRGMRIAALSTAILAVSLANLRLYGTPLEATIFYYLGFFLAGFLAADNYLEWLKRAQTPGSRADRDRFTWLWDLLALAAIGAMWLPFERTSHVLLPFVFLALFSACFRGSLASRATSHPFFTTIGGTCYTIYLYHTTLIAAVGRVTKNVHLGSSYLGYFLLQAGLMLPVILMVSIGMFVLVERPCMDRNWPKKLMRWLFRARIMPSSTLTEQPGGATPH